MISTPRKINAILLNIKINPPKLVSMTGNKAAKFHGNILSLSENIAKSFRELRFWLTVYMKFEKIIGQLLSFRTWLSHFRSITSFRNRSVSEATAVEHRGQISHFLTPRKFREGMNKMSESILRVLLRIHVIRLMGGGAPMGCLRDCGLSEKKDASKTWDLATVVRRTN